METRGDSPLALGEFAMEIGVPTSLIMDPSSEQTSNKVEQFSIKILFILIINYVVIKCLVEIGYVN